MAKTARQAVTDGRSPFLAALAAEKAALVDAIAEPGADKKALEKYIRDNKKL